MQKHYFLIDNVVDAPHDATGIYKTNNNGYWTLDNYFYHFDDIDRKLFYNIKRYKLLDKNSIKFVIQFVHLPISCDITLQQEYIDLVNTDNNFYLILYSPLEYIVDKNKLFTELENKKLRADKVICISNDLDLHNTVDRGVKFVGFDFWSSYTRHHYRFLPNVSIITPEERYGSFNLIDKKFICLNRNLKQHRIWFYYSLTKHNMLDDGYVSYALPTVHPMQYKSFATSNLVKRYIPKNLHDEFEGFVSRKMPVRHLDNLDRSMINHQSDIKQYYYKTAISLVTESSPNKPILSEKTYKAIMNMHPFCIIGDERNFELLKKAGYETFENLFGVDIVNDYDSSVKLLENLKNTSLEKLTQRVRKKYFEKCEFNFWHFLNSKTSWNDVMNDIFALIGDN